MLRGSFCSECLFCTLSYLVSRQVSCMQQKDGSCFCIQSFCWRIETIDIERFFFFLQRALAHWSTLLSLLQLMCPYLYTQLNASNSAPYLAAQLPSPCSAPRICGQLTFVSNLSPAIPGSIREVVNGHTTQELTKLVTLPSEAW